MKNHWIALYEVCLDWNFTGYYFDECTWGPCKKKNL